ncbi:MAG: hypothetical protein ABWZ26_03715 [Candidatus Nanopelagicales bacterium]
MTTTTPPGWPREVRPPDAPGWELSAVAWLLDQCPADYRGYHVLRRHPVVLARFAARYVDGALAASRTAYATLRADLRDQVEAEVLVDALTACEREGARLLATQRAVGLVEEALRGKRFVPRL